MTFTSTDCWLASSRRSSFRVNETHASFSREMRGFADGPSVALVFGRLGDSRRPAIHLLITHERHGRRHLRCRLLPNYASRLELPRRPWSRSATARFGAGRRIRRRRDHVAEHAPAGKRASIPAGFRQPPTLGLFAALLVVIGTRTWLGEDAFKVWGWRIPFIVSVVLLGWFVVMDPNAACRESGLVKMKNLGPTSKAPLKEAFGRVEQSENRSGESRWARSWTSGVWYAGHSMHCLFLERTLRVDAPPPIF